MSSAYLRDKKIIYPLIELTTAIINRICFMPATLRLNGSGVNAVGGGGEEAEGVGVPVFAPVVH